LKPGLAEKPLAASASRRERKGPKIGKGEKRKLCYASSKEKNNPAHTSQPGGGRIFSGKRGHHPDPIVRGFVTRLLHRVCCITNEELWEEEVR